LNAVVASGEPAAAHVAGYDSCWIDFTKGLGAAVGAALAGSQAFIDEAWRLKQRWGGAMRQSGVISAMCLYALDHHVARLAEDNALARSVSDRLAQMPGVAHVLPTETNIVIFDLAETAPDAATLVARLNEAGVVIGAFAERRARIVTHMDVDAAAADALIDALGAVLG
jgi:threonine aldolase